MEKETILSISREELIEIIERKYNIKVETMKISAHGVRIWETKP